VVAVNGLRIAFFGTPAFAVPTLEALLGAGHDVVAVITQPDRPRGRGQRVTDAPVKAFSNQRGLEVLQPDRLARDAFEDAFSRLRVDLGVVAAYGKLLPEWLLSAPRLGMINVHASLLPKYRGAAPVHRAVIAGARETGVTIMRVVKALDAGPMLASTSRPIGRDESSDEVEGDLAQIGADLLVRTIHALIAGTLGEVPQDESEATYAPRLVKSEGLIDFRRAASEVHNQVRGLRPWPGAYTSIGDVRVTLHRARVSEIGDVHGDPGTCVRARGDDLTIACGDRRAIDVLAIQPEGRRVMTARELLAGHPRLEGGRFG
jgi:methionyl-tRNA formyltransferase